MFDNNPFREFKEMMKQRRLQENEYYGIDPTGTDPTTGTGIERNITGPTAPSYVGMDYNGDRAKLDRRGNTPKTDEKAIKRRKRLRKYATRARGERYRLQHEAEAERRGISVEELYRIWDEEDARDRASLEDHGH